MLVVMDQDSTDEEIGVVQATAEDVGLSSTLFSGEPSMVLLDGDPIRDVSDQIAALPGVVRVALSHSTASPVTSNLRIAGIRPLISPAILMEELPLSGSGAAVVQKARNDISRILNGDDDRLLVVVGPCSIHDADAAIDYARRLARLHTTLQNDLLIVMRVYFEKPRTTVGWKGLINDPHADESFAVNDGLHIARQLLLDIIDLGLPAGCEFLDPITPQFIADSVSWAAIGARTTESQVHRNLASGLSMPVGFKNGTSGDIQIAVDAIGAASYPHQFMSVTEQGLAAIVETRGNRDTHVILRGGQTGTNYDSESIRTTLETLGQANLPQRVMVDASHGNSGKDFRKQPEVASAIADQVRAGQRGISGVMVESFIEDGNQKPRPEVATIYGMSVTDSCMGWELTVPVLEELANASHDRRVTR